MSYTAAELETMIAEAKAQRHQIALGNVAETVSRDGRMIRTIRTTIAEMDAYIRILEGELAEARIVEGVTTARRRRTAIGTGYY